MNNAISIFQNKTWNNKTKKIEKILPESHIIPGINNKPFVYNLHDNMIDPMIRFIHHRKIKTVGWIQINNKKLKKRQLYLSTSHYNLQTKWNNINAIKNADNSKIRILCYDIECTSSHGDFPLPKRIIKFARKIVIEYKIKLN